MAVLLGQVLEDFLELHLLLEYAEVNHLPH